MRLLAIALLCTSLAACATAAPQLQRVRDPFGKLVARSRGVRIDDKDIFANAESE